MREELGQESSRNIINVYWENPPHGWYCLNTDGAAKDSSGVAGCGGLIRDDNGNWVCGFAKYL
ncbi:putative ribonuclease H protein, partial [Trifolium medium]|nr:putative ribonuclease H protein [Trifolium medium]